MEVEKEKEKNQSHDSPKTTSKDTAAAENQSHDPEPDKDNDDQNNNAGGESESPEKKPSEQSPEAGESRKESSEAEEGKGGDGGGGGEEEVAETTNEEPPPPDFNELCEEMDKFIASLSAGVQTEEAKTGEAETEEVKTEEEAKTGEAETDEVKTEEEAKTEEEVKTEEEAKTEEETGTPEIPDIADQFAFLAEANIANHDLMKWNQLPEDEASSFLEIVDRIARLSSTLCAFSSVAKYGPLTNRTGGILQRAMSYLEDEFRSLLEEPPTVVDSDQKVDDSKPKDSSNSETEEPPEEPKSAGDKNKNTHGYSEEVVKTLNTLATTMIKGGYETECFQVYIVARRTVLEETLHKSGFEKLSIDEIQRMQWEPLEREIESWNNTFKQFVTVHFVSEKDLLSEVFRSEKFTIPDDVFNTLSRGIMIQLLNFAEAVAVAKRSSEKLFKFIDIYETLRDVVPKFDELWNEECTNELKSEANLTRCRLGEGIVSIFTELENSIKADTGKTQVPGGAVHPLTRYTMNYLKYACESKETLEQVFREHQKIERADSVPGSDFDHTAAQSGGSGGGGQAPPSSNNKAPKQSPFAIQICKVMDLLDTNLDAKSKLYKDHALSSIFMMNNGRYILQKIKGSAEIHALMGDTWSRKRSSDLRQYHKTYQRETWGRLLGCLNQEGLNVNGKVMKPVLKEKFKAFNAMFDEIHKTQSMWVVSDEQLQSELRVSISAVVIPAYRSFLARFAQTFTPGRQTEKYIKYQPEDIETYIDELFDGNATPTGRKKQ